MMRTTTATTTSSPWLLSSSSSSGVVIHQGHVLDDPSAGTGRPVRKSLALVIASTVCVVAGLVLVLVVTVLYVTPTVKSQVVMCHVEGLVIRRKPGDDDDTMTPLSMASVTPASTSRTLSRLNSSLSVTKLTSSTSSLTSSTSTACSTSSQKQSAPLSSRDVMNLSSVGLEKQSALCVLSQTPEIITAKHPVCLEIKVRFSLPDGSCRYGFLHRAKYGNATVAEVSENVVVGLRYSFLYSFGKCEALHNSLVVSVLDGQSIGLRSNSRHSWRRGTSRLRES